MMERMSDSIDDLVGKPGDVGIGAVLMIDPMLPVDEFGFPYQALVWFDGNNRPTGLVLDVNDHPLAYQNNEEGDPSRFGIPAVQRMPSNVEAAAIRWLEEEQRK